jgi:two-component system chemotaxis sensor kinase CheA
MMSQDDAHRLAYLEEAKELLADLEASLLELERTPDDTDLLHKIFRAMHTIKGSGAMFGFDDIAAFTHDVETVFDKIRNGLLAVTRELLDLSFHACDHIRALLEPENAGDSGLAATGRTILDGFRRFAGDTLTADTEAAAQAVTSPAHDEAKGQPRIYRLRVKPHADMLSSGNNPLHLLEDVHALGECRLFPHVEAVPALADIDPEACLVWWDCVLRAPVSRQELTDIFVFAEDDCDLHIDLVDDGCAANGEQAHKLLGQILLERGDITAADLEAALSMQKRLGDILAGKGLVQPSQVASALAEQSAVRDLGQKHPERQEKTSSIRVAADKLDFLVDLVGELVIVQAQIRQAVDESGNGHLRGLAEHLERLSESLRDSTLSIRMLPIGATFAKFRRLVRDLSTELGKDIELVTSGEETELDKTVIERLSDPLVHLLRNSIDHGVEPPAVRLSAGKPQAGRISLGAAHVGGEVCLTVADDGGGLDPVVIRAKAEQRGLLAPGAELSTKEIYHLIFQPGFSTAKTVTNISGRGVGMDVVKRAIDSLRGSVEIDSVLGQGTTISIRLPLTLAIIDGLQVQVAGEYYVVPLALVEECVELARDEAGERRRIVNLRGEVAPVLSLREAFELGGTPPAIEPIVVARVDGERIGIAVDRVVGEHQTVIKGLGRLYRDVDAFSGATIRGDGSMALIIDVAALVRREALAEGNRA